jgi:hypothetical protein
MPALLAPWPGATPSAPRAIDSGAGKSGCCKLAFRQHEVNVARRIGAAASVQPRGNGRSEPLMWCRDRSDKRAGGML